MPPQAQGEEEEANNKTLPCGPGCGCVVAWGFSYMSSPTTCRNYFKRERGGGKREKGLIINEGGGRAGAAGVGSCRVKRKRKNRIPTCTYM